MVGAGDGMPPVGGCDCWATTAVGIRTRLANAQAPSKADAFKAVRLFAVFMPHLRTKQL
jgi:hypothetical protein